MNQKGFVNIILVVVIIVLVGVVGYFALVKKLEPLVQQPTPTPTSKDETANWKIYKNTEYGFQLTFTDEWTGYGVTKNSYEFYGQGAHSFAIELPTKSKGYPSGYATPLGISVIPASNYRKITGDDKTRIDNTTLGKTSEYIFYYYTWQDVPPEYQGKDLQIDKVAKSFKFSQIN